MKIIILDYTTAQVHIFSISIDENIDSFLQNLEEDGIIASVNDCHWMTTKELNLQIHEI